jgi:hypothetical protein
MKPHVKIQIRPGVAPAPAPHWQEFPDKSKLASLSVWPTIDTLFVLDDWLGQLPRQHRPVVNTWIWPNGFPQPDWRVVNLLPVIARRFTQELALPWAMH